MAKQDKISNDRLKKFERYLEPCPNCGREILYHMKECPFCHKEVPQKYYSPIAPEKARRIRLVLGVIGFVIALIIIFVLK